MLISDGLHMTIRADVSAANSIVNGGNVLINDGMNSIASSDCGKNSNIAIFEVFVLHIFGG